MPNKCCVPGCRGNYSNDERVRVYSFPKNPDVRSQWLHAIPRKNFTPGKYSKVCQLHFIKDDFIYNVTEQDSKTGQIIVCNLNVPRLKTAAIPSQFPNCPSYYSKPVCSRKSRDDKLQENEQKQLLEVIEQSKKEHLANQKLTTYFNFEEFLNIFNLLPLPEGWHKLIDKEKVMLFKLSYVPGPTITYAVLISSTLTVETFLHGQEYVFTSGNVKTPFVTHSIDQIQDILVQINTYENVKFSENINNCLKHVSDILSSISTDKKDHFAFIAEQLQLETVSKERHRYSPETVILCSLVYTISPHAYKFLRHSNLLILPHSQTIKNVCNVYLTNPAPEEKISFLTYAKNIYKFTSENDRNIILLADEIHIKPYLDYKAGNIVGTSYNDTSLASSAYVFMIASVSSNFKEVVQISPISKIDSEQLYSFIKTIIVHLEKIGYKVFCVITDNNALNSKAMANFSSDKKLRIVYPHPSESSRPLFYLFDSVHILKCIRNNWINSKPNQVLCYPDFDNDIEKIASFTSLKTLHNLEHDKLLKFGYSLTLKALFPSSLEKQNVKLAIQIFNPFVVEALKTFGTNIENANSTADFINIILMWWKIVNVKTPFKGIRLNDCLQEPIMASQINDKKIEYLEKLLNWLEKWKTSNFNPKLTSQTHTAFYHTVYGMLEIIKYCFDELNLNYVLLGKFQTDPLEDRFGKYRQLAGGQYHISVRQLYESENKLRIQSLLTLKSKLFGTLNVEEFSENFDLPDDRQVESFSPNITINEEDIEDSEREMPVITYLGGYCCYVVLKRIKCESCKKELVCSNELVVEDNFSLIKNLSRGKLLYPQDSVTQLVLYAYILFNKLLQNYEEEFLNVHNKRSFFYHLVLKHMSEMNSLININNCNAHQTDNINNIIINCVTNIFLKNYCGKRNDRICQKGKRKLATLSNK